MRQRRTIVRSGPRYKASHESEGFCRLRMRYKRATKWMGYVEDLVEACFKTKTTLSPI